MRSLPLKVLAVAGLGWVGCATTPVPNDQLSASRASIRAAEEVGAEKVPQAALHLQYAKEQTARATRMIDQGGDNAAAALMLERAEADASLAISLAKEAPLREEAQKALHEVQVLQQQQQQRAAPTP